jgi:hypothetical protein
MKINNRELTVKEPLIPSFEEGLAAPPNDYRATEIAARPGEVRELTVGEFPRPKPKPDQGFDCISAVMFRFGT